MNHKINTRSAALYAGIALAAIMLLTLVSASLGGRIGSYGMRYVPLWFSLLPVFVIATALFLLFGSSGSSQSDTSANGLFAKILTGLTIVGGIGGVTVTYVSTWSTFALSRAQFVLENTGVGAIFVAGVAAALLINTQRFVYFPLWNKVDKARADERQLLVRQRVFEKSYRYLIVILAIAGWTMSRSSAIIGSRTLWITIVLSLSIPSLLAAWQKDS